MSLAELAARPPLDRRGLSSANIVTLDIERLPGVAEVPFWDLGDYRHRRISADYVTRWPRTICLAWRRYGRKQVEFAAEWQDGGEEGMLRRAWEVYDEADIIVGHNVAAFDTKKLKAGWALLDLPRPRPWKTVDTLTIARREFGFESNTLRSLAERLGVPGKIDKYDPEVATLAVEGNAAAQRRLRRYNIGDVESTEAVYDYLRPWIANHPFVGTHGDDKRCQACDSDDLTLQPTKYRAVVLDYALYRCNSCRSLLRGGWVARAAMTRGVPS